MYCRYKETRSPWRRFGQRPATHGGTSLRGKTASQVRKHKDHLTVTTEISVQRLAAPLFTYGIPTDYLEPVSLQSPRSLHVVRP